MDKQMLARDMQQFTGGKAFINQSEIAKYLGRSRDYVREITQGMDCLKSGKSNFFHVRDIAGKIMEERKMQ